MARLPWSAKSGKPSPSHMPTREQLIAEVRRQAMGGVMPTQAVFNDAKPAIWATASAHMVRLNLTWEELAAEAGLKPKRAAQLA